MRCQFSVRGGVRIPKAARAPPMRSDARIEIAVITQTIGLFLLIANPRTTTKQRTPRPGGRIPTAAECPKRNIDEWTLPRIDAMAVRLDCRAPCHGSWVTRTYETNAVRQQGSLIRRHASGPPIPNAKGARNPRCPLRLFTSRRCEHNAPDLTHSEGSSLRWPCRSARPDSAGP